MLRGGGDGYDLYVTRAKDWARNEAGNYCRRVAQASRRRPGAFARRYNGLTSPSGAGHRNTPTWFDWWWYVHTKTLTSRDREDVGIAERVNGKVQGDDGEVIPAERESHITVSG